MTKVSEIMQTMEYGPSTEDASAARDWLARRGTFGHFINGSFTKPGETFETRDPATGEVLARVTQGTADDVAAAVKAARRAQKGWAALSGTERARQLYALARHVQKRERFLSVLETLDNGKPIREARDIDVPLVARHFYHHAGWAELRDTRFPGHAPLGVCGQIIPWNFPLLMLAWKIAPALAAGNTVVLKPAEYTPLTALAFAEICQEVGLPAGVVNIVTGDGATGAALVAAEVDKIAFTGSTEVGRGIATALAGTGRKLTLELGGKSPFRGDGRRRSGRRRRGRGGQHLVQPGPGLLRGLAHPGGGIRGRAVRNAAVGPHGAAARRRAAGQVHRYRRHRRSGAKGPHPVDLPRRDRCRGGTGRRAGAGRLLHRARLSEEHRPRQSRHGAGDLRPHRHAVDLPHRG